MLNNRFGCYLTRSISICFFCLVYFCNTAFAADLMDVYRQALDNDPTFKAALSRYKSRKEAIPQAWSALLPQLQVRTMASRNQPDIIAGLIVVNQPYGSSTLNVVASQDLFNYGSWAKVQRARSNVKAQLARFNDAAQNLIIRTSYAYLDLLFAHDTLKFAEAKQRANKRQLDQAQQRFNVGLDAITSVYEAKAAHDRSYAQVIAARNNLANKGESLREITNHVYDEVAVLRSSKIPLLLPEPNNVDKWVATGLSQNYKLFAEKFELQAARDNIKVQSARNLPTLSLEGSTIRIHNTAQQNANPSLKTIATDFFFPSREVVSNVGLTLSFPVFRGGLVLSKVKQAQFEFETASEQLEKIYRDVVSNSRMVFNTIVEGISMIKADRQTIVSQTSSLDSVEAQYGVGTRTMTDVVSAQQYLFEAQKQLAGNQYRLIKALLRLKYLAGSLSVRDLEEVNSWLATTRVDGQPPQYT